MIYSLTRLSDGAGDSGMMSDRFIKDEDKKEIVIEHNARPKVNSVIQVVDLLLLDQCNGKTGGELP